MKKMLVPAAAVFLLVVLACPSTAAWGDWRGGKAGPERSFDRITKKLELTQEQKERFKARNEKMKESLKADQSEVKQLAEKLKSELQQDKPDRSKVHDLIKQISARRTEMELKRMDALLEMRQDLTPEQRVKFKALLAPRPVRERRK